MPVRDMRTYLDQIPRLRALEALQHVAEGQVSAGLGKDGQQRIDGWQALAGFGPTSRRATVDQQREFAARMRGR